MTLDEFAARIESPHLKRLFDGWQAARTDARAPDWAAVEAAQDRFAQENVWGWALDAGTDQVSSFVMGPKVVEMFGFDGTGRALSGVYPAESAPRIEQTMRETILAQTAHRTYGMIYWRSQRSDMGERLMLPVRFKAVDRADAVIGVTLRDFTVLGTLAETDVEAENFDLAPIG